MAQYTIRVARGDDLDALREVYRRSSLSNEGDREVLAQHPEWLVFSDAAVREQRTRVAVVDGRVVGFSTIAVVEGVAELEDLFVDPDWMRRGVARALIVDVGAVARSRGIARIEVTANSHARDFYEAVGFVFDELTETEGGLPGLRMHLDVSS